MKSLSDNLDSGRKIPMSVEIAEALSKTRHDGRKINNGDRLALFIQQIQYWLDKAQENRDKEANGMKGHVDEHDRLWFYNGMASWRRNFSFWSEDTVRRLRDKLVALGIVLTQQRGQDWYNEDPNAGETVTWYSLDYDVIDALALPPGNLRGGATCEGDLLATCEGGTPGNLPPHTKSTKEKSTTTNAGSPAPGSVAGNSPSYDQHAGKVLDIPRGEGKGKEPGRKGKDKPSEPVGETGLQRYISSYLGIKTFSQDMLECLNDEMRSHDKGISTRSAEYLYANDPLFRRWLEEQFLPWFEDRARHRKASKLKFFTMLRGNWDWWARWSAEQSGPVKQSGKKDVLIDQDDPRWDVSNFCIPQDDDNEESDQ